MMLNNLDVDRARIFLRYLAKASVEKPREVQVSPILSDRILRLAKRLDEFIHLQEAKKLAKASKKEIKAMLEADLARVKKHLIQAKKDKLDSEKLYSLVERAEKIKEKIKAI